MGKTRVGAKEYSKANRTPGETAWDWGYTGDYREYTLNVDSPGNYNFILNYASTADRDFLITKDGDYLLAEIAPSTGSWGTWVNHLLGTIELSAGINVIKLESLGSMDFRYFELEKAAAVTFESESCTNLVSDELVNFDSNGTKAVRLTKGQKMTFTVTAPKAGYYCIKTIAAIDDKPKTINITTSNGFTSSKTVTGTLYEPYKPANIADIYLKSGENTFDIELADGISADFDKFHLFDTSVELYSGEISNANPIDTTTDGKMTAKISLNGLFDSKDVFYAIAVYEGNTLKYISAKNQNITGDAVLEIPVDNVTKADGKTYTTKVFAWNNMMGVLEVY